MAEDTTAIEHLLQGRQALEREVARLSDAIEQLDSVIALFDTGGASSSMSGTSPLVRSSAGGGTVSASTSPRSSRRPPARKAATRGKRSDAGDAPKSIREHVLDMLAAENREFGLAEIIDRIHGAGIQAHDDAVRSITIKLMKDGQVERVGRGQYRLAGSTGPSRGSDAVRDEQPEVGAVDQVVVEEIVVDVAPADVAVEDVTTADITVEDVTTEAVTTEDVIADDGEAEADEALAAADEPESDEPADEPAPAVQQSPWQRPQAYQPKTDTSYTPPLNLGQPWG